MQVAASVILIISPTWGDGSAVERLEKVLVAGRRKVVAVTEVPLTVEGVVAPTVALSTVPPETVGEVRVLLVRVCVAVKATKVSVIAGMVTV